MLVIGIIALLLILDMDYGLSIIMKEQHKIVDLLNKIHDEQHKIVNLMNAQELTNALIEDIKAGKYKKHEELNK